MLEKIALVSNLRNLSGLSKSLLNSGRLSITKCFSTQVNGLSRGPRCMIKAPIFSAASQLGKVQLCSAIQKRAMSSDHSQLWKIERVVAAAFLPLVPACFLLDSTILDALLAVLAVVHTHWGLEAIIVDYARPAVVGPVLPKVLFTTLYIVSAVTLAGLLVLCYNGPGITKVIKQGWAIGRE